MRPCPYGIGDLLPHAPPMVLLDSVTAWDDAALSAVVTIGRGSPFRREQGVPAHVGLEYMAQACGAFAGIEALAAGEPVRLGLLLRARRFVASVPWFSEGDRLIVSVAVVLRAGRMGVFDCRILRDGDEIASAQLTVFEPDDVEALLGRQGVGRTHG